MKRKIAVFTSTRADYGLLYGLLKELASCPEIELQLVVSGTHLEKKLGETIHLIDFPVSAKVPLELGDDSVQGICHSQGLAIERLASSLKELAPHLAVVLGDRFEALSFAIACSHLQIPLAHIHGGELTLGAVDDAFRHSITKLSYWHFTAAEEYRKRVIRLGEHPDRVYTVGAPGVENIFKLPLLEKSQVEANLNFKFKNKNILITFHPETNTGVSVEEQTNALLSALKQTEEDTLLIFTMPNADTHGQDIKRRLLEFISKERHRAIGFETMGQINYLSSLKVVDMVVGNSSSGIIEAPSFNVPTVNIGDRQKGRIRATSVIDCPAGKEAIQSAMAKAWDLKKELSFSPVKSPFQKEGTARSMAEILIKQKLPESLSKEFYEGMA